MQYYECYFVLSRMMSSVIRLEVHKHPGASSIPPQISFWKTVFTNMIKNSKEVQMFRPYW